MGRGRKINLKIGRNDMREEWINRKVKIEDAPSPKSYVIGKTGRICRIGGLGVDPGMVCVKLSNGPMGFFSIDQLKFVDEE